LQDSVSEVISEENFNTHNLSVDEVKDQVSRGRIQREALGIGSVGLLRFGSRVECGAEIIATAAPVNDSKEWHLFKQVPLILFPEKRG